MGLVEVLMEDSSFVQCLIAPGTRVFFAGATSTTEYLGDLVRGGL